MEGREKNKERDRASETGRHARARATDGRERESATSRQMRCSQKSRKTERTFLREVHTTCCLSFLSILSLLSSFYSPPTREFESRIRFQFYPTIHPSILDSSLPLLSYPVHLTSPALLNRNVHHVLYMIFLRITHYFSSKEKVYGDCVWHMASSPTVTWRRSLTGHPRFPLHHFPFRLLTFPPSRPPCPLPLRSSTSTYIHIQYSQLVIEKHNLNTQSPSDRQSFGIITGCNSRIDAIRFEFSLIFRQLFASSCLICFHDQTNLKDAVMMVMIVYWMRRRSEGTFLQIFSSAR